MSEEQRDINRRVALALGWKEPRHEATCEPWGDGQWWEIDGVIKGPAHQDFCRDPAAADLVRLEIERRGWTWITRKVQGEGYAAGVFSGGALRDYHREESGISPHIALCLAFLAADEESKAAHLTDSAP